MGRLKAMPSRLSSMAPRLGSAPGEAEPSRDRDRAKLKPWRAWYGLKRWKDLRREVFARAGYVCEQTGVPLTGRGNAPNAPVADHIVEHKGDPVLFWDPDNVQCVAKSWHDGEKQRQERADG